ncbi:MAG: hypothetical protein GY835_18015 [bacterium]|nr:hypothetical protein [bacterium]
MNPVSRILNLIPGGPLQAVKAAEGDKPVAGNGTNGVEGFKSVRQAETINDIADCKPLAGLLDLAPGAGQTGKLQELTRPDAEQQEILDAVKQFESIFLRYLASAMNKTMPGSDQALPGGQYYQGLIDAQMGDLLAQEHGLGLGESMLRQLGTGQGGQNDES